MSIDVFGLEREARLAPCGLGVLAYAEQLDVQVLAIHLQVEGARADEGAVEDPSVTCQYFRLGHWPGTGKGHAAFSHTHNLNFLFYKP